MSGTAVANANAGTTVNNFSAQVVVPNSPGSGAIYYHWIGLQPSGGAYVLQCVLEYDGFSGWSAQAVYDDGTNEYANSCAVSPGDSLSAEISLSGSTWTCRWVKNGSVICSYTLTGSYSFVDCIIEKEVDSDGGEGCSGYEDGGCTWSEIYCGNGGSAASVNWTGSSTGLGCTTNVSITDGTTNYSTSVKVGS